MSLINLPFKIAISPCPNDTFAFYHFFNDSKNYKNYKPYFFDIEELNQGMLEEKYDVTKASFPAFCLAEDKYELLDSGSAIGFGVGPIVVYSSDEIFKKKEWNLGLPGKNTTANFLWTFYLKNSNRILPEKINLHYLNFSEVMKKTASGELDVGVVIHEGRFVYHHMNLKLLDDLGEFWQKKTSFPVPLGGIFIKKKIIPEIKSVILRDLKSSISLALTEKKDNSKTYKEKILPFIKGYSQELDELIIEKHIDYYVNNDTVQLSESSKNAINFFLENIKTLNS